MHPLVALYHVASEVQSDVGPDRTNQNTRGLDPFALLSHRGAVRLDHLNLGYDLRDRFGQFLFDALKRRCVVCGSNLAGKLIVPVQIDQILRERVGGPVETACPYRLEILVLPLRFHHRYTSPG